MRSIDRGGGGSSDAAAAKWGGISEGRLRDFVVAKPEREIEIETQCITTQEVTVSAAAVAAAVVGGWSTLMVLLFSR